MFVGVKMPSHKLLRHVLTIMDISTYYKTSLKQLVNFIIYHLFKFKEISSLHRMNDNFLVILKQYFMENICSAVGLISLALYCPRVKD